ncbi:MAG: winged helix-turn-helix domain-containing protein [Solirubrobacterales bacterium]
MKTTPRAGQRGKSIEEVVAYALGHRIRVYVLTILNEGTYTPDEIARIIGEPLNKVSHHIKELLDAGSIELAKVEKVRNADQHYYRAVEMPYYSDEDMSAMTPEQRQVTYGLILQCMTAEAMAALWGGRMHSDPRVWMGWRWFNVDERGRQDLADEQQRSWERIQEIEVESTNRRAVSGEDATSIIMAQMGFERERTAPTPPATGPNAE